jgi:hypothetical protein
MNLAQEFNRYAYVVKLLAELEDVDMVDPLKAVTTANAVLGMIKTLYQYAEEIDDTQKYGEFMRTIGELNLEVSRSLATISEQVNELRERSEQIRALNAEVQDLKSPKIDLVKEAGLYYDLSDKTYAYCPRCYSAERKINQLSSLAAGSEIQKVSCLCGWHATTM